MVAPAEASSGTSMRIDVVAPGELSARDIAAWSGLQAAHPALASPYLSPDWALACAAVDGPDRQGARVVVLREGDEAVGFLPLRRSRVTARPVGAPMCDYQGLVARPGLSFDPRALLGALEVGRVDFTHMLADQAVFAPFAQGRAASQVIDVSEGYEAYAAERRDSGRSILKDTAKKLRKLEREYGPVVFTPLSDSVEAFERLIALKRAQYRLTRQTDIFEAGWPLELLRKLFATRDERFGGALFTLEAQGRLAAMHFALRMPGVLHCWFIAHDPDFERFSPGVALIDHMLRWGPENGVRELDLGPGDYRFKLHLANRTREVVHGYVGRLSPQALVRGAQYRVRQAAEALPLGRVSALPGKAMRRMDVITGLRA
jgi:CelD/BcsL family acetyltransferase involved in cellulose biosynthesis